MRNTENANDFAVLADVIDEVKNSYKELGKQYNTICCILPTAPFVSVDLLIKGFKLLKELKVDSVRPIVRFSYPIQRALKKKFRAIRYVLPRTSKNKITRFRPSIS